MGFFIGTVIVHPGWAKSPERHKKLLARLETEGFLPLGVATRYAYADRRTPRQSVALQPYVVGSQNPYFTIDGYIDNRWRYRRPTVLLDICDRLGIGKRSYVGHAEGARVSTLATTARPDITERLIVVNGAGIGDSSKGATRLTRSNVNRICELARTRDDFAESHA